MIQKNPALMAVCIPMETVTILRTLWRVRRVVVGLCLFSLLVGTAVIFKMSFLPPKLDSRRYEVGVASARILVDTPSSQVVEVAPKGSDTLGVRANLLASLMVDGVIKAAIAHRAGLQPDQLVGVTNASTDASVTPTPTSSGAYLLKTSVLTNTLGEDLPVIEIDAQAPTEARASSLAAAAVAGLRDYLNSKAALQQVPNADRLQVNGLGSPQASTEARGPSAAIAMIVVVAVFLLGCAAVLGVLAIVRGWRDASVREQMGYADGDEWQEEAELEPFEGELFEPDGTADWPTESAPPTVYVVPPVADDADEPQAQSV